MTARLASAIDALVQNLQRLPNVERVILFGSRARGDEATGSDVDLAVEAPSADELEWDQICDLVENADTLLPIDFVRLEHLSPRMRQRVSDEGKVLFARAEGPVLSRGAQARDRKAG